MDSPTGPHLDVLRRKSVIDLAQPLRRGIPVSPNHPAFEMALIRRHGDMMRPDGGSAANELIVLGGHVGTHIDAPAHVSHNGMLYGGVEAASVTSNTGFSQLGIDSIDPIACRGVLLDLVEVRGDYVPAGDEVTVDDLEAALELAGVDIEPGDAVLLRTGWSRHWDDPDTFLGTVHGTPGPGVAAGRWLADRHPLLVGAETIAFERIPPGQGHAILPVHRILLVDNGIYIVECMNLDALAAAGVHEFFFVLAPLYVVGATGAPTRPLAFVDEGRT